MHAGKQSKSIKVNGGYLKPLVLVQEFHPLVHDNLRRRAGERTGGLAVADEIVGVEVRRVPLTARLGVNRPAAWGNVLYVFDIMAALATS